MHQVLINSTLAGFLCKTCCLSCHQKRIEYVEEKCLLLFASSSCVAFRYLAVCMFSFETLLCACCLSRPCCVHVVFRDLAVYVLSFETLLCACCLSRPCCVHVTFRDLAVCMLSLLTVVLAMSSIPISHLVWPLS